MREAREGGKNYARKGRKSREKEGEETGNIYWGLRASSPFRGVVYSFIHLFLFCFNF